MNCEYCSRELAPHDSWGDSRCLTCYVIFSIHEEHGKQIIFIRTTDNRKYCLNLFPNSGFTILIIAPPDGAIGQYKELVFNYNIPSVTPQNVSSKIKTLLVFS